MLSTHAPFAQAARRGGGAGLHHAHAPSTLVSRPQLVRRPRVQPCVVVVDAALSNIRSAPWGAASRRPDCTTAAAAAASARRTAAAAASAAAPLRRRSSTRARAAPSLPPAAPGDGGSSTSSGGGLGGLLGSSAGAVPAVAPDALPEGLKIEPALDGSQSDVEYDEESKTVRVPLSAMDGGRRTKLVMFTCNKCGAPTF